MSRILLLASLAVLPAAVLAAPSQPVGIARAVAAAERALPGRALEAELEARDGRFVYEVEVMAEGLIQEVLIDARTGRHIATSPKRAESLWRRWFDSDWAATARLGGPLAPRLAALERQSRGRVREVGFEVEGGVPLYEIEIQAPAGKTEVHIDARTGERLTMFDD